MEKTKLEMEFLDSLNKKFIVSIDEPRIDLTHEEVRTAMEAIIAENVFESSMEDIVAIKDARIITTTIETLSV